MPASGRVFLLWYGWNIWCELEVVVSFKETIVFSVSRRQGDVLEKKEMFKQYRDILRLSLDGPQMQLLQSVSSVIFLLLTVPFNSNIRRYVIMRRL